jgi:hypothetical protein
MCFFGGGDDGSKDYLIQQQQQEAERQAKIDSSLRAIDAAYSDPAREKSYGDYYNAVMDYNKQKLDTDYQDAIRQLEFANLRSGQSAGSSGATAVAKLKDKYTTALQELSSRATAAKNNLFQADQGNRSNLVQLAMSGLDATTAARLAQSSLSAGTSNAANSAKTDLLGDYFGSLANSIIAGQQQAGRISAGRAWDQQYGNYFANGSGGGYGGTVRAG